MEETRAEREERLINTEIQKLWIEEQQVMLARRELVIQLYKLQLNPEQYFKEIDSQ